MADPVVTITNGVPTAGSGTITTLGQTLLDGANATLGVTTGAAVTTSAAGTIQQYLRGIVSLLVSGITVASHAVTNAGTFAVQATLQTGANVVGAVTQSGAWVISAGTALIGKVGIDQTTDGTTNKVAADLRVAGSAVATGAGASGATVVRTTLASDSPGIITTGTAGSPSTVVLSVQGVASGTPQPVSGTVSLTDISNAEYETVAASATAQVLGATGGTGDYLSGILVIPATTSPGNVLLLDNATSITVFAGGASSVSNLVPFFIPLGAKSVSGAWKLTTGTNVSCIGIGNFT